MTVGVRTATGETATADTTTTAACGTTMANTTTTATGGMTVADTTTTATAGMTTPHDFGNGSSEGNVEPACNPKFYSGASVRP